MKYAFDFCPNRTGKAVHIAIVDSGVHAEHPHVAGVAGGIFIRADGALSDDYVDRLGHGTAVAAAIREKAPAAGLYAIKIFSDSLAVPIEALIRAIDWAAEAGARLINLSLGTSRAKHEAVLLEAVERAPSCLFVSIGLCLATNTTSSRMRESFSARRDTRVPSPAFQRSATSEASVSRWRT